MSELLAVELAAKKPAAGADRRGKDEVNNVVTQPQICQRSVQLKKGFEREVIGVPNGGYHSNS